MKISVAMTCYNGSKYLTEQLESLKNQTMKIDEVRIVDDNSEDNSVDIIKDYVLANGLKNWTVTSNTENAGWIPNFHKAISQTTGDIVFFCDQDDIWHKDKVRLMTEILISSDKISTLACRVRLIDGEGRRLPDKHDSLPFDSKDTGEVVLNRLDNKYLYTMSPGCTLAVKREFLTLLYSEEKALVLSHDTLCFKIGTALDRAFVYDRALMDYRIHSGNASNPSAAFKKSVKSVDRRVHEVDSYITSMSQITEVSRIFRASKEYIMIMEEISRHLERRKKWLKKEYKRDCLLWFLEERKYYRSLQMFMGDVLARRDR